MQIMGMEAAARISELRKVAQWYVVYAFVAPLLHGFIAFGLGMIAHYTTDSVLVRRAPGRLRRLQFRHFRTAYFTGRYPVGQSLRLHRLVYSRRHASCDRLGNTALYGLAQALMAANPKRIAVCLLVLSLARRPARSYDV